MYLILLLSSSVYRYSNPQIEHFTESMETIYGDMSKLLASASDVVSCDVPRALEVSVVVVNRAQIFTFELD